MSRNTYVYRPGHPYANERGFVNKSDLYGFAHEDMRGSFGNAPISVHVISDTMPMTRHMANGQMYDSKHKFRQATRAAGCIEVGNESTAMTKPRQEIRTDRAQLRNDLRRAFYEVRNGRKILEER